MWVEKNGPTWRVRDLVDGKKVTIKSGFETKTEASKYATGEKADKLRGDQLKPQAGQASVGEFIQRWWASHSRGLKPSGRRSEGSRVRNHLLTGPGVLTFDEIEPEVIQTWVWDLADEMSPKTVRNVHGLLYVAMDAAVNARLIRRNPCSKTKMPEAVDKEMMFLTEPEAARLVAALPEEHRALVVTALGTGMRWGEIIGLRVGRVDILARKLTVLETVTDMVGAEDGFVTGTPKTRASQRTITLPGDVLDVLIALVAGRGRLEWVFTRTKGALPVARQHWGETVWRPAVKRAGLEGLRFHDLRHTHASWLISGSVPLTAVQRRLGHESIATTSDRYGHLLAAVDTDIMAVLDLALKGRERKAAKAPGMVVRHRRRAGRVGEI